MVGGGHSIYSTWELVGNVTYPRPTEPETALKHPVCFVNTALGPQCLCFLVTKHRSWCSFLLPSHVWNHPLEDNIPFSPCFPSFFITPTPTPDPHEFTNIRCPCFYQEPTSHASHLTPGGFLLLDNLGKFKAWLTTPKAAHLFCFPVAEPPILHLFCIEILSF